MTRLLLFPTTIFNHPARTMAAISTTTIVIGVALTVIGTLALLGYTEAVGFSMSVALILSGGLLIPMALGGFLLSWTFSFGAQGRETWKNTQTLSSLIPPSSNQYWLQGKLDARDLNRVMRTIEANFKQRPLGSWTAVVFGARGIVPDAHPVNTSLCNGQDRVLFVTVSVEGLKFYLFPCTYTGEKEVSLMRKEDPRYDSTTKQVMGFNPYRYDLCYAITLNPIGSTPLFKIDEMPTLSFNKATRLSTFTEETFVPYKQEWEIIETKVQV